SGRSITLTKPLRVRCHGDNAYSVDGTPVDSVIMGLYNMKDNLPDLVVSGINKGGNLGTDLPYSGTFEAAAEAVSHGFSAIAVSLFADRPGSFTKKNFNTAAVLFAEEILPFIEKSMDKIRKKSEPWLFNVNIPVSALDNPEKVISWTFPGERNYGGDIIERRDPRGGVYYWIGGNQRNLDNFSGSDCRAVIEGHISVTPVKYSFADMELLDALRNLE
ncbi:MAG: 5'/3'-nucleotidase SurE, partial [bacterium]